jgi:hypothetical protein
MARRGRGPERLGRAGRAKELESEDRRKLWGSPVRVYAAPPGTPRPHPARLPEEQGWQELTRGARLRRPRAPGTGAFFQQRLARLMAEGNPWVVGHWRRLADKQGPAKDAEVERIEHERSRMVRVAEAARELQRLQPDEVRSWTSGPPFGARTTWIPMIGEDLARIRGLGNREWMTLRDRVLLVVHPERDPDDDDGRLYGFARLYSAPPATPPPDPAAAPAQQGWTELEEGDFLLPWLLHITRYELCERPCCAPFRDPKPGG